MAEIKILVEGYVKNENDNEYASSTTVLLKENGKIVIVDPGMDRRLLMNALKKQNISTKAVDYVILTHSHSDHSLLSGVFENAKILDDSDIYQWDGKISSHNGKVPGTTIEIIKTPGHDMFHCSVLVQTNEYGKVAIVGDVFWWKDDQKQETDDKSLVKRDDPYVKNLKELTESRKTVLELADYIIPGHGKMFKVKK